jgi:peptidylamidoglycolate lyase
MNSYLILFLCLAGLLTGHATAQSETLGQGEFRYSEVPNWGKEALESVRIKNGHGIIVDKLGRIVFLTDDPTNNVIILDRDGKLIETWTARMPGAHGLTSIIEGDQENLFITDTALHEVRKLSLDGKEVLHLPWPEKSGLYQAAAEYRPSKVLLSPLAGEFFVFDGYGKDYIHHYRGDGSLIRSWGGDRGEGEDRLAHFGPHGGIIDTRTPNQPVVLECMSDRLEIKRFTLDGKFLDKIPMPGGNPRDAVMFGQYLIIPHLSDNWPADKNATGFISVLDQNNRIISNVGGSPAIYSEEGVLQPMKSTASPLIHPHAVALDADGNLYVAQFASPKAPLLKLERLK